MKKENISDALNMIDESFISETAAKRESRKRRFMLPKIAVAAIAVMICGTTAIAAVAGGHFVDIKNIFGAVTGTQYVDATEEISVTLLGIKDGVPELDIEFKDPAAAPFSEVSSGRATIKPLSYKLTDSEDNTIIQSAAYSERYGFESIDFGTDLVPAGYVETDQTSDMMLTTWGENPDEGLGHKVVRLVHYRCYVNPETGEKFMNPFSADILEDGTYSISIESFVIESKADQPLEIFGDWNVEFTI